LAHTHTLVVVEVVHPKRHTDNKTTPHQQHTHTHPHPPHHHPSNTTYYFHIFCGGVVVKFVCVEEIRDGSFRAPPFIL
jgi:hypothetical protein